MQNSFIENSVEAGILLGAKYVIQKQTCRKCTSSPHIADEAVKSQHAILNAIKIKWERNRPV